jgi:ubiquinone/menaquinone biosynthesis C-methylase UbiE
MERDIYQEIIESHRIAGMGYYEVKEVDRRLSYFVVRSNSIICDVGSASGIDAFPLAMAGALCVALDTDRRMLEHGKSLAKRSKGLKAKLAFIVASATNLPIRTCSIDLVTCFSVLDHIPDFKQVQSSISEFHRVIKDSGRVSITFPNKLFIIGNAMMKMKQIVDWNGKFFERRFTPKQMRKMIIKSGLTLTTMASKYPTKASDNFLTSNMPLILSKFPRHLLAASFLVAEQVLQETERRGWFRICGARFGYLCQKPILYK